MGLAMPTVDRPQKSSPLAALLRPVGLADVIGQRHLLGPNGIISRMAAKRLPKSAILWGPPGTGKTSLVRALSREVDATFWAVNATSATVKEIREIINAAVQTPNRATFVFVDEIHRWSKSQQDVLLPSVEDGTIVLFGATTEKPKFAVNSTILSRLIVLETKPLDTQDMIDLVKRIKAHYKAKDGVPVKIDPEAARRLILRASGDARKLVTALETCVEILADDRHVTVEHVDQAMPDKHIVFDSSGNEHFDLAHAYQEAIQNSDTDGALYWLGKWIASGEDPAYICRRMLITSFEDCAGNPFAWLAAMAAHYATERTGLPECMIPMAVATCEMGKSKRNKAAYSAIKEVMDDVNNGVTVHVPTGLRAGTAGYVHAVSKRYLKRWVKDWSAFDTGGEKAAPTSKRPSFVGTTFAIGSPDGGGSFGMWAGPNPDLDEMLGTVATDGDVLFEFYEAGDGEQHERKLYRWDGTTGAWKRLQE